MSPFALKAGQTICLGCGARIGNTSADKIEHLTTPSRARARQKHQRTNSTPKRGAA